MKNRNILSDIFTYLRDVIDSANDPLVLLILVLLPLIVPFVPAFVSAMNLHDIMGLNSWLADLAGVSLELLGFASAILALRSITAIANAKKGEDTSGMWIQVFVDVGAWFFYLAAVVTINIIMDNQAGKPPYYIWVIAVLCLLSIPSSLLAASRINLKEANDKEERRYQEHRSDKMKMFEIVHQTNERTNEQDSERTGERTVRRRTKRKRTNTSSPVKERIYAFAVQFQETEGRFPTPTEIQDALNVSKGYASEKMNELFSSPINPQEPIQ